jgi:hypothetical protein
MEVPAAMFCLHASFLARHLRCKQFEIDLKAMKRSEINFAEPRV